MPRTTNNLWFAHALAFGAVVIWGANFPMIRILRQQADAVFLVALRLDIALIAMALCWLIKPPRLRSLTRRHWVALIAMGLLCGTGYQSLVIAGSKGTTSGLIAMLVATQTLHVGWLGWLLLGERLRAGNILAIGIAAAGVGLPIALAGQEHVDGVVYPLLIALAGAFASLYIIIPRRVGAKLRPWDMMSVFLLVAALTSQPLLFFTDFTTQIQNLRWQDWVWLLFIATIGQTAASLMWWWALRSLRAVTVAFYTLVLILAATFWGWLMLDDMLTWIDWLGALLVTIALVINIRAQADAAPPPKDAEEGVEPEPAG